MERLLRIFVTTLTSFVSLFLSFSSFSAAYEQTLDSGNYHLERWEMPLVRLIVKDAKSHQNDNGIALIEVDLIEIIRKGEMQLGKGPIRAQWRTYREASPLTADSWGGGESVGEELFDSLMNVSLICFVGSASGNIILYADACFVDGPDNKEIAVKFSKRKPIGEYLYDYAWLCVLLFPLIGFILIFALPKIGMVVSASSFPAGVYILSEGKAYDAIIVYPALILAGIVTALGFARLLHQMVKEERKDKAVASQDEASSSD
ncbi:hypothetical protein IAI53_02265 [Thauera sp. CAU 1555]|uniref:Transmembrane protein n=1 Tax=Thauera sedimentorum TaxID=2767595 RepID=A0ABR9B861_9RHOO|nr:hypothetical protein [Thauera sedimentorum]MBC9070776.1 hypothetical protein [Thauera sedimentorum]MBD8501695.1 hypothetical protein [Thauera sedimentorum]